MSAFWMHAHPLSRYRRRRHRRRHHQRRHVVASWSLVCARTPDSGLALRPPPKMPTQRHRWTNGRRRRPRQTRARETEPRRKRRKGKRATCRTEEKREEKEDKTKEATDQGRCFCAVPLFFCLSSFFPACAREPKKKERTQATRKIGRSPASPPASPRRCAVFHFFFFRAKCIFFSVGKKRPSDGRHRRPAVGCVVLFLFSFFLNKIQNKGEDCLVCGRKSQEDREEREATQGMA